MSPELNVSLYENEEQGMTSYEEAMTSTEMVDDYVSPEELARIQWMPYEKDYPEGVDVLPLNGRLNFTFIYFLLLG